MDAHENVDRYKNENLREHFDSQVAEAERAVMDLDKSVSSLPPVNEKGESPCMQAKDYYAQKEEREDRVRRIQILFREYVPVIEREMDRALENLSRIHAAESSLHSEGPRQELSQGESAARNEYRRLVSQRERAIITIERMAMALSAASRKRWPLGVPREGPPSWGGQESPGMPATTGVGGRNLLSPPNLSNEIAALQSIHAQREDLRPGVPRENRSRYGSAIVPDAFKSAATGAYDSSSPDSLLGWSQ